MVAAILDKERVVVVLPTSTPFFCHLTEVEPVTLAVKVAVAPAQSAWDTGSKVMIGACETVMV